MKHLLLKILLAIASFTIFNNAFAQKTETAIILLRHAEKDTVGGSDPQLSAAGKLRAKKLLKVFDKVKADEMYSTPYIRTMETLKPWAEKAKLNIKAYDAGKLKTFAEELKLKKGIIVVAGHSNTTPALVNFLLGEEKYKALDDSVYSKIWVVKLKKDGTVSEKLIEY
jgi:phosphohistidine phosphatase SixA